MTSYQRNSDSGRKVETIFCKVWGKTIFWTAEARPGMIGLGVGTIDDTSWVENPANSMV